MQSSFVRLAFALAVILPLSGESLLELDPAPDLRTPIQASSPAAAQVAHLASLENPSISDSLAASGLDPLAAQPMPSLFDGRKILAFYGRPGSTGMGILGEYPKAELANLLFGYARLYDGANGGAGVIPAFYIVYGACWPEGEIGLLRDAVVREWIEYAGKNGILVFLDHQIGRFGVDAAMKRLLPWLAYPNVHLAIDPEWSTDAPMKTIGSISAEELNRAQAMMAEWLSAHGDRGERFLVVHQFTTKMIAGRDRVRADYPGVRLIHTADGFGSPPLKKQAYALNALAGNMPRKGFKLFMKTKVRGAGYDQPLLTPEEVVGLVPSPELIIYQ